MAHTDNSRRLTARRRLRGEAPSTVAVLADERDFAAMRRYDTFTFDDHAMYLRQVEGLLRAMAAKGTYTSVALFDPDAYEQYCTERRLDPDTPASRTRYTADIAAQGVRVPYEGQPIARLLPDLVDQAGRQTTWERASRLLARAGGPAAHATDSGQVAFARASRTLRRLIEAVGTGAHHLVCTVPAEGTTRLVAVLHAERHEDGHVHMGHPAATVFCTVLAAGFTAERPGGLALRSMVPGRPAVLRAWGIKHGTLVPMSEAEVFSAYCTDALNGDPVPPEHGVEHRAGIEIDTELDMDLDAHFIKDLDRDLGVGLDKGPDTGEDD
ncbi:hypothetical protein [Streptomyces cinnamoneus]|uniref:hypothetical protein n=1 Tax=Streptomyces cinnamoneus TaxID=53446 RepID=UPI001EFE753D|nr:hypothetical protein [Streptomyces cinnamoneus]